MTLDQLVRALQTAGSFFSLNVTPQEMGTALAEASNRIRKLEAEVAKLTTPQTPQVPKS